MGRNLLGHLSSLQGYKLCMVIDEIIFNILNLCLQKCLNHLFSKVEEFKDDNKLVLWTPEISSLFGETGAQANNYITI